ncbi:MAG: tRNA (adenosine(37)-N6)-dimethylallyltransferase MiaA [Lachnospiraceae bacterium]|nr:tRNA (adenosine(37)-N6)-dimethylallyltransferase MiaA [Lachnospiraceae bacterium]
MKNKLIIITGPTAVGKSDLSVKLAKRINGEIISADSMQVYKGMDIGTAKITKEKMQGVLHHLIDICDPSFDYNVYEFKKNAENAVLDIYKNGHIPIICGGTGFYIQSLLYDIDFEIEEDDGVRKKLEDMAQTPQGIIKLHELLKEKDPEYADTVHPNNVKRVIRALEYIEHTGNLFSEHNREQRNKESKYDFKYFVLTDDRDVMYERIDKRVELMMDEGLLDEVKTLKDSGIDKNCNSMQAIGYKQLLSYLDGNVSLDKAVSDIKQETRHYAKRQLTWFRREKEIIFIDKRDYDHDDEKILDHIIGECGL